MRRITCLTDFALALFCMLLCVPIASGQQPSATGTPQPVAGPVHFYFCASNQIGVGHTAYISNVFAVSQPNSPPIESEYLGFLKKMYSYPANQTACFDGYLTREAAQAGRQTRIEQFERIKDKVVETSWTYSAALSDNEIHSQATRVSPPPAPSSRVQKAAPEAALAATAAGQSVPGQAQNQRESPYICSDSYSDRQTSRTTFYRTGVFQAAASLQTISDAWARYVIKTYHLPDEPGPNCTRAPSDPAGQQYTETYMDQTAQAHKGVIVHVDWQYTLNQATAPVAQAAPAAPAAQPPATAAAGQGTPPGGLVATYYCFAYFDQNSPNNYASSVSAVPMREDDFAQFVKEKYQSGEKGEKVTGSCYNAQNKAQAEAGKAQFESTWRPGHKWIETGWAPTTIPVASGKGIPSYCSGAHVDLSHGGNGGNLYFTAIFEIPPRTPLNPVFNDFGQFVFEKYGERITATVTCPSSDNMDPEKQLMKKSGYKIIDTGWKPKSLPPPSGRR